MSTPPRWFPVDAFIDGELELTRQLEFEARLHGDAALAAQVEQALALRHALRRGADYHAAPAALQARIRLLVAGAAPAAPRSRAAAAPSRAAGWQRWFAWRPFLSAFAALALLSVALQVVPWRAASDDRLEEEVIASHVRATLAQRLVDVASSDHHTVKPWLSSRLDFSPPVPDLNLAGSVFLGGRVDYAAGRPVAVLAYRQGQHLVDAYVWPSAESDRRAVFASRRGFQVAHWTRRGMTHWVVSDLNRGEFASLVAALETLDSSP